MVMGSAICAEERLFCEDINRTDAEIQFNVVLILWASDLDIPMLVL